MYLPHEWYYFLKIRKIGGGVYEFFPKENLHLILEWDFYLHGLSHAVTFYLIVKILYLSNSETHPMYE